MTTTTRPPVRSAASSAMRSAMQAPLRTSAARRMRNPRAGLDLGRRRVGGAIAAAAIGGVLFGPTFGKVLPVAVVLPVLLVAAVTYAGFEATLGRHWLRPWRVPLTAAFGTLVIIETVLRDTTSRGVPTATSFRALGDGLVASWRTTLQTSSPAAPQDGLVVFVPIVVLVAALLGTQLALRKRARGGMLPVLPGFAVALTAEWFHALALPHVVVAVVALAFAASAVGGPRPSLRSMSMFAAATALGALVAGYLDPAARPAFSLRDHVGSVPSPVSVGSSPLNDIKFNLEHPGVAAFSVQLDGTESSVDRWPVAVLDKFDGTDWTPDGRLRHLGTAVLPPHAPSNVAVQSRSAGVYVDRLGGPWLPTQPRLEAVSGITGLVDENSGSLLHRGGEQVNLAYRLRWSEPQVRASDLDDAVLATGNVLDRFRDIEAMGAVPTQVREMLRRAVGNAGASFQTAFALERFFQRHYRRSVGTSLPAGHNWLDIAHFLTTPDAAAGSGAAGVYGSGSPEQFATAYAAMARLIGIPARVVVGYTMPAHSEGDGRYIIRSDNMTAWPEVPVQGVGWVPIQPMGLDADGSDAEGGGSTQVTRATERARDQLPSGRPPTAAGTTRAPGAGSSFVNVVGALVHTVGVLLLVLALFLLVAIPGVKYARAIVRRRRAGSDAVVSAWRETCDLLLDHGVRLNGGMTVRDVAGSAAGVVDQSALRAMEELVELVDEAVWSGDTTRPHVVTAAWRAADQIRTSLSQWPVVERVAAGLAVHSLRPDRPPLTYTTRS